MMKEVQAVLGEGQPSMEPLRCLSSSSARPLIPWRLQSSTYLHLASSSPFSVSTRLRRTVSGLATSPPQGDPSASSAGIYRSVYVFLYCFGCVFSTPGHSSSAFLLLLQPFRGAWPLAVPCALYVAATLDRDLHSVLELASDAELHELSNILYGQSLLSPLLKSMTRGDGSHKKLEQELEGRDALVDRLESRFLYLGADAKETLRGWRPTYRDILLCVRAKLSVHCSTKLSTEDLEVEIFLHLLQQNTRGKLDFSLQSPWKHQLLGNAEKVDPMTQYSKNWHVALKLGGEEILKVLLKGGSVFSISFFQKAVARKLGGKVLVQTARYQVAKEVLKKGGQAAASNLQARVAVLAARQGLAVAASCYATLQRTSMLFGPLLWGTFLAEVVIKSVGTDYARVVKAIYAFAQIRLLRTYGWTRAEQGRPA